MKVEVPPSSFLCTDDAQQNLKQLLEVFGSVVSLEDIASAYCETAGNLNSTAEILSNQQGGLAGAFLSKSEDDEENTTIASSGSGSSTVSENAPIAKSKPKKCSASMGTVSDVIGKDYIAPRPQPNGLNEKLKPVKLNSDDFPVSEIWNEEESASTSRSQSMDSDVEEFLYKMLGSGFQLEMNVIHDVVGQCGYNMAMSINKLLDLSAETLEKSDDVIGIADGNIMENSVDLESMSSRTQSMRTDSGRLNADVNSGDQPQTGTKKKDIGREVLESLFSVPNKIEEKQESSGPSRPSRCTPYGQVVAKPLEETVIEDFTFITTQPVNKDDEANQNNYEDFRKAVQEYWVTMKEYYKAALEAFIKKDYKNAQRLLEEGSFFMKKAREADERSAQRLIDSDEEEEMSVNMHYLEPKDAVRHMKLQLTAFSGLPCTRYLKVVVGTNGVDSNDRRRKRLITKLLEREGITWTEEGNGWTISIRADEIDPNELSFANK